MDAKQPPSRKEVSVIREFLSWGEMKLSSSENPIIFAVGRQAAPEPASDSHLVVAKPKDEVREVWLYSA